MYRIPANLAPSDHILSYIAVILSNTLVCPQYRPEILNFYNNERGRGCPFPDTATYKEYYLTPNGELLWLSEYPEAKSSTYGWSDF